MNWASSGATDWYGVPALGLGVPILPGDWSEDTAGAVLDEARATGATQAWVVASHRAEAAAPLLDRALEEGSVARYLDRDGTIVALVVLSR